ncbi:cytochrome P450 [Micromonospora sonneratiae]|uniref:Cytochrome P450 n=1 Tax=Micromonospora sonneratiae TaxID=1184706 RepID=A0ABW3YM52_9ACTN
MTSTLSGLFDISLTAPHQALTVLRTQSPVCRVTLPGDIPVWLVTRHEDVQRALTDPRLSNRIPLSDERLAELVPEDIAHAVNRTMLTVDPPDHTRLRRLVVSAFTARRINGLRPRIEEIADQLATTMSDTDHADLLDSFAFPLPIQVICELLGVPMADRASFRNWSNAAVSGAVDPEGLAPAMTALVGYVRKLVAEKRAEPADDLLSALIIARDDGDRLSDDELTSMVFLLLVAGHETTVNLIGNGTLVLLTEPQRWDRLVAEPDLVPGAVEEFLRFESPVQTAGARIAVEPIELGGQLIPAGDIVLVSLLSANRDPEQFAEPDRFDPTRPTNPHLAFGRGIHFCLGAPLARLEGEIAFRTLLRAFPGMRLAVPTGEVPWRPGLTLRGLASLPVRLK